MPNRAAVRAGALRVLLVIVLGAVVRAQGRDLRHDLVWLFLLRASQSRLRGLYLLGRARENRAAVLVANVRALAVPCGGVVDLEEDVEQSAIRHALGIEF